MTLAFLALGFLFTLSAPYFLTKYSWLDLTQTGQIGDTIGGITSPITNLLGAVLVFYAFKAQIESNELTRQQFKQQKFDEIERKEFTYLAEQANTIRNEINEFGFVYKDSDSTNPVAYKGVAAFDKLIDSLPDMISYADSHGLDPFKYISQMESLRMILTLISSSLDIINRSKINTEEKKYLIDAISYQYLSKIRSGFEAKIQQYSIGPTFNIEPNETTQSVFTDKLFNIVREIDCKIPVNSPSTSPLL